MKTKIKNLKLSYETSNVDGTSFTESTFKIPDYEPSNALGVKLEKKNKEAQGMRKIGLIPVLLSWFFILSSVFLSIETLTLLNRLGSSLLTNELLKWAVGGVLFYLYIISFYRIFLHFWPLKEGEIAENSQQQFVYDVYILFYLLFFYPLMRSNILPVPMYRVLYKMLGAKLGPNTFPAGLLFDPQFVEIGANAIIGSDSFFVPHSLEGNRLAHQKIKIGDNVTIGFKASVLGGVIIEDNAIVAAHSLVTRNTHIKKGELWAGVPARKIK